MSLHETLELMALEADATEELTSIDFHLVRIGFDPANVRSNTQLYKTSAEQLEIGIDAIFSAANAGNSRAKFLIMAAAQHQSLFNPKSHTVIQDGCKVAESDIKRNEMDLDYNEASRQPIIKPIDALKELDESIAIIEITLENVRNGIFESE